MLFRMLLGRTAMKAGNILVNPANSFLAGPRPQEPEAQLQEDILDGESE
jgi:hypothetical protein